MLMRSPLARDRRQPPGFIRPCQPVLAATVPAGDGWLHELKHDGFRIIVHKDGDDVRLWSRNARDWSVEFVPITAAVMALPFARIVLDGEAVAHCPKGGHHLVKGLALRPRSETLVRRPRWSGDETREASHDRRAQIRWQATRGEAQSRRSGEAGNAGHR